MLSVCDSLETEDVVASVANAVVGGAERLSERVIRLTRAAAAVALDSSVAALDGLVTMAVLPVLAAGDIVKNVIGVSE